MAIYELNWTAISVQTCVIFVLVGSPGKVSGSPRPQSSKDEEDSESFYEAAELPEAPAVDAQSLYFDAPEGPAPVWDAGAAAASTIDFDTATKVDELLLEELEEAWELESRVEFDDDVSVADESVISRRTRASAIDATEADMKIKEMAALRQALDFAMSNMLLRQARCVHSSATLFVHACDMPSPSGNKESERRERMKGQQVGLRQSIRKGKLCRHVHPETSLPTTQLMLCLRRQLRSHV
jgi:hypothetical protein